jgi:hypothetical protein
VTTDETPTPVEFPFAFDTFGQILRVIGLGARFSRITVDDDHVTVLLGWGFRATIPRSSISSVEAMSDTRISRGAHGWRGHWLVNGAGSPLVALRLDPPVRARVLGFPITLRRLDLSPERPDELVALLSPQPA